MHFKKYFLNLKKFLKKFSLPIKKKINSNNNSKKLFRTILAETSIFATKYFFAISTSNTEYFIPHTKKKLDIFTTTKKRAHNNPFVVLVD